MATAESGARRKLGNSGLDVAPLMLGGNVFGWTADEATSGTILDAFVAAGLDFVDTANVYSRWVPGHRGGESEAIIGRWFRRTGKRDKVVLATKVGMDMGDGEAGLTKAAILRSVEASLARLQTDRIDLYQTHKDDQTPLAETLGAYETLIRQGKVRAVGASNYTPARLEAAIALSKSAGLPAYHSLQPEYNLCERAGYEAELEPICLREGLGVVPYYALASGFLTGKYRSEADLQQSPRGAKAGKYLDHRGRGILAALDAVAARLASTPARVALAWLIARPSITAPIASATSLKQLDDLVAATRLTLDDDAVATLDRASAWG